MTIYAVLRQKLGREPTFPELKADIARILEAGLVERAKKGQLAHQRKPRSKPRRAR
jgi:hypothetical protein